jgi:hypothetical protein
MDHSNRTYNFKKYDLVAGKSIDVGEAHVTFIGIVIKCDNHRVEISVVWCNHIGDFVRNKPWFLGDEIEFKANRSYCMNSDQFYNNIKSIGDLSFPWDIPGHYPMGGVMFDSGRRAFEAAKEAGKIANKSQFKNLLAYVRINVESGKKRDVSHAIIDFFNEFGWEDHANKFLQGCHADNREWDEAIKNGTASAQPIYFI